MKLTAALVLLLVAGIVAAMPANAELYVAGEIGYTVPNDLFNIELKGAAAGSFSSNLKTSDFKIDNAAMFGAKVGYYLPLVLSWLGLEAELYHTNLHSPQQTVTVAGSGGTAPQNLAGSSIRTTVLALNLMVRYPGSFLQPYVGIGPGIFFTRVKPPAPGASNSDTTIGLNALAGLRVMIIKNLGIFAEYKYNRSSVSYDNVLTTNVGLKGDYSSNTLAAGVSLHF
jgi:opacity protein-like surface antigen